MSDKKNQNHMNSNRVKSENKLILIKNPAICFIVIAKPITPITIKQIAGFLIKISLFSDLTRLEFM